MTAIFKKKDGKMKKIIIIRGLPGSGKSTLANFLANDNRSIICEADEYFTNDDGKYNFVPDDIVKAHNLCMKKFTALVNNNAELVIISNTSVKRWEFEKYALIGKKHGYEISTLIVENRHGNDSVHNVPKKNIENMRNNFEVKL